MIYLFLLPLAIAAAAFVYSSPDAARWLAAKIELLAAWIGRRLRARAAAKEAGDAAYAAAYKESLRKEQHA